MTLPTDEPRRDPDAEGCTSADPEHVREYHAEHTDEPGLAASEASATPTGAIQTDESAPVTSASKHTIQIGPMEYWGRRMRMGRHAVVIYEYDWFDWTLRIIFVLLGVLLGIGLERVFRFI